MSKKKLPLITLVNRDEVAKLPSLHVETKIALADIAEAMREGLTALSCVAGLLVIARCFT
jgi:hypothetical protein